MIVSDQTVADARKILVVDDDETLRLLAREALYREGFAVEEASNGCAGLERARQVKPDLVMLDVRMPGMNGFDVCATLRRDAVLGDVPIVIVTALDDMPSVETAYRIGATSFITKPIQWKTLAHTMRQLLRCVHLEAELRTAMRLVEEATQAKSEFLSSISHALRTPLDTIIGFSELIASEALGPVRISAYRDYAGEIRAAGNQLLGLAERVTALAQAAASISAVQFGQMDLEVLLEEVTAVMAPRARQAGIALRSDIRGLPLIVSDEANLRQAVRGLLDNAINFTPSGGRVALIAEADEESVILTIEDNGMVEDGVASTQTLVERVEQELARPFRAPCIGLPVAHRVIELLGGSLSVQSERGRGTSVRCRLPLGPTTRLASVRQQELRLALSFWENSPLLVADAAPRPSECALLQLEVELRGPLPPRIIAENYLRRAAAACRREEDRGWTLHRSINRLRQLLSDAKGAQRWFLATRLVEVTETLTSAINALPNANGPFRGGRRRDDPQGDG